MSAREFKEKKGHEAGGEKPTSLAKGPAAIAHSMRAPEALTTRSYLASSALTKAAKRSGDIGIGSAKKAARRARISLDSIASTKALFRRSVVCAGSRAGPKIPNQVSTSNLARPTDLPASAIVGTSGMALERAAVVTASALSRPALMLAAAEARLSNVRSTWPESNA